MESMHASVYAEQLRKAENLFITKRVTNEQIFQRWIDGLKELPEDALTNLGIDRSALNIKVLLSESYKDKPSEEVVNEQINNVNAMIERVNGYIDQLNNQAVLLCQQMESMENKA